MKMLCKQDFTIGAIWKMARRRKWPKTAIIALLVERAKVSPLKARLLCEGWLAHSLKVTA
jgi:hypothetical protein